MKKIFVLFLILFAVQAQAAGIYTTVARGTVTQANMKISAVDGTAFVDFSAADVLTTKIGHLLKIRDSSGRAIQGYIKAAGTGETLGSDVLAGWDFTSLWSTTNAAISDNNTFVSSSTGGVYKDNFFSGLTLYKLTGVTDQATMEWRNGQTGSSPLIAMGSGTFYFTPSGAKPASLYLRNLSALTTNITLIAAEAVLTPSATGVTIVSTKGGSTFNFALKNSSFNYNDPSGYTYEIIQVRQAVLMDSDACLNANATINLTDGSATWACAGIDDSAFQDGKHMITVSDATGKTVLGYYENAGSGDVVNTKSGSTNNWIWKDASFSTAGDYTRKIYYVGD